MPQIMPINWIMFLNYSLITFHMINSLTFFMNKKHLFKSSNYKNFQFIKYMNY